MPSASACPPSKPEPMQTEKLVYMANQIGKFFAAQSAGEGGEDAAAVDVADHLKKYWDARMRMALLAHLASGGAGLDPIVRAGAERLAKMR